MNPKQPCNAARNKRVLRNAYVMHPDAYAVYREWFETRYGQPTKLSREAFERQVAGQMRIGVGA